MRVADTSALYALLFESDFHHEEAKKLFEDPEMIIVPAEIWSETISLIHFRDGYESAREKGSFLLDLPHLDVRTSLERYVQEAWNRYLEAEGKLSYPDSVVVIWCEEEDGRPLAFDEKIQKRVRR